MSEVGYRRYQESTIFFRGIDPKIAKRHLSLSALFTRTVLASAGRAPGVPYTLCYKVRKAVPGESARFHIGILH